MPHSESGAAPTADRPSILVVDDDDEIRRLLERYLGAHGFEAIPAGSAMQSRAAIAAQAIDLVLLDLGLPDEDGLVHLKYLQTHWRGPVIVVTGRGEAVERVVGLELGADDYVTKPFDFRELVARIRTVLRRAQGDATSAPGARTVGFAGFTLDLASRHLRAPDGRHVPLTTGEFELLQILVAQPHRVLSRDQLMNRIHGRDAGPYDRAIDVRIGRLRRKLDDDPANPALIKSVRGAGYLLAADVRKA